jgi:hypothetical protein
MYVGWGGEPDALLIAGTIKDLLFGLQRSMRPWRPIIVSPREWNAKTKIDVRVILCVQPIVRVTPRVSLWGDLAVLNCSLRD